MADNYLEKKYDEFYNKKVVVKRVGQSFDNLLKKNRSFRGYDKTTVVTQETLKKIVAVNTLIPSARNQQVLRFKTVTKETGAHHVLGNIKLGGALPELQLPLEGTEPEAFIIICSTIPESRYVDIDLGISAQSMLLKAVEMGLNGIAIGAFDKEKITTACHLPYEPLLILAIGKGTEDIRLTSIHEADDHNYYRENGIHYVPKIPTDDLLIL